MGVPDALRAARLFRPVRIRQVPERLLRFPKQFRMFADGLVDVAEAMRSWPSRQALASFSRVRSSLAESPI